VYYDCPVEQLYEVREELLKSPREKFCCFVTSNDRYGNIVERREEIFRLIHGWRHVDSAGADFNNTGYLAPKGPEFLRWISQYRFMICPENSKTLGYITEKALQAWLAGTIPIYDGGSLEGLNSEAFVSASGNYLEEIQALEMDPDLFLRKQRAELYRERPSLKAFEEQFREVFKLSPGPR
jgi:alpha(1,3/1,4) fucosyltransferase